MVTPSKRRLHRVLIGLILLVILSGAAVAARSLLLTRGPLVGETRHDFGLLPFEGRQVLAEHTYVLTNRSSAPVLITSIKPSCGCTKAEQSADFIEPGDDLEIAATLRLGATGQKGTTITIGYEHEGEPKTRVLHLSGTGRKLSTLTATKEEVRIRPERGGNVSIFREMVGTTDPPPPMEITVTPGYEYELRGWKMSSGGGKDSSKPYLWFQMITITFADEPVTEEGLLHIEQPENQKLDVTLIPVPGDA